jgi:nucleotide-binding universal stress UspA family protein
MLGTEIMAAADGSSGQRSNDMPGIVVGIDGSSGSQEALEWAVRHAAVEHLPLTVLAVHEVAASTWTHSSLVSPEDRPDEEKIRQDVQEEVSKIVGHGDTKPESVTVRVISGQPANALIEASHDNDLVVVGSRGGGGFPHLRLGSVTSKVVSHAESPVVVVRHSR